MSYQHSDQEPRYWELELNYQNIKDLLVSAQSGDLVAIVDEETRGIIGYVMRDYSEIIVEKLNASPYEF